MEYSTLRRIVAAGIFGSFFLPWVNIFIGTVSGYDLAQFAVDMLKDLLKHISFNDIETLIEIALLLSIPLFSAVNVITVKNGKKIGILTGMAPIILVLIPIIDNITHHKSMGDDNILFSANFQD